MMVSSMIRCCAKLALLVGCVASMNETAQGQGYSPAEAARKMTVADGLEVQLVAHEPMVRQPVAMTFDERGRLWVIQYLQYPNPAGLKRVTVDRYSRTEYDQVPEPPPHGPRGADRITILEDTDGDGAADSAKDFVSGLNIASGMLHGHGGLYVLQSPYLLFYPDRNRDDVPDGDPEVLLKGFGLQDAHAVANSLAWGPDGWLYGAQGSTVTANIRGISFQQGIWRYHPTTREFELFAEGGGNTWGVDFDRTGHLIAGTNVGPNAMLHQVQGGYYWKSFGKHGELHNPYAFGYLEHVQYADFRGGHVTCGGIVYSGDTLPAHFKDRYIAANLLSHAVYWHELSPQGSSFTARFGGELLVANDDWFAPVDVTLAPDGSVLIADWHDQRTAHPDPDAQWDRTNGRIYRVQAKGAKRLPRFDLAKLSTEQLVALLDSPSGWHRATARRLLVERGDSTAVGLVETRLQVDPPSTALESLWTLASMNAVDETLLSELLDHKDAAVRAWAVRLLGDNKEVAPDVAAKLVSLAADDSPAVRNQLACTAQRLPAEHGLPIVFALARKDADATDPQIPLLLWWALERHADRRDEILNWLSDKATWQQQLVREHLVERLARRYAARGEPDDLTAVVSLLRQAPDSGGRELILRGINLGLRGRRLPRAPGVLPAAFRSLKDEAQSPAVLEFGLRIGDGDAQDRALALLASTDLTVNERTHLIAVLGDTSLEGAASHLFALLKSGEAPEPVRLAALAALGRTENPQVSDAILSCYAELPEKLKAGAIGVLVARPSSAAKLVDAVRSGSIPQGEVSTDHLRQLAAHDDANLESAITSLWGKVRAATPEERLAVVRRLNNDLRAASGDVAVGKTLFTEHCAKCHTLHGEGNLVGPDLTTANRGDRDFLLVSMVDPSVNVRKEYLSHVAQTTDGRVLTGIVIEETDAELTLLDANNQRQRLAKSDLELLQPAEVSLMPEGLLEKLTPGQLRDLFSYLQSSAEAK